MTLNDWQEKLGSHFSQLRERRLNHLSARGILYALEHGLNELNVAELRQQIHEWLKYSGPASRHFLAWAVYSAEIGYQYSGEEYWTTFCRLTPGWQDSQNSRGQIRSAFEEFHRKFNATHPQGAWAEHFTIICWPITHAILPKDRADQSPFKSVLSSAIGGAEASPEVFRLDISRRGGVILLCSDGLTKHVSDEEIALELGRITSSEQVCRALVDLALERGGSDNVTVLAGRAHRLPAPVGTG